MYLNVEKLNKNVGYNDLQISSPAEAQAPLTDFVDKKSTKILNKAIALHIFTTQQGHDQSSQSLSFSCFFNKVAEIKTCTLTILQLEQSCKRKDKDLRHEPFV